MTRLAVTFRIVCAAWAATVVGGSAVVEAAEEITAAYQCDGLGPVEARFGEAKVELTLPDGAMMLPQLPSGSGARYGTDQIEFWIKGDDATLTRSGASGTSEHACHVSADKAN